MPRYFVSKWSRRAELRSSRRRDARTRHFRYQSLFTETLEQRWLLSLDASSGSPTDDLPRAVADNYSTSPGVTLIRDVQSPPGPLAWEDSRLGVFPQSRMVIGGQEVVETSGITLNPGGVVVRGAGSHYWAKSYIEVGRNDRGRVVVEQGGRLTTSGSASVGDSAGGVGDVIVSGAGSLWDSQTFVHVGEYAGSQGSIRLEQGGLIAASELIEVGQYAGAVGEITVVGTGSLMTVASRLNIASGGTGTLRVGDGGTITAGLTTIGRDGQLIGDGTLQAGVINFGVISAGGPRGVLTLRGALTLTSSGSIEFDIGGTERGIAHDGIDVVGDISGSTRLLLRFVDGFAPRAGDEFRLVEFTGTGSLTFNAVEIRNLAPGFQYTTSVTDGAIVLRAVNDGVYALSSSPGLGVLSNDQVQDGGVLAPVLVERATDGTLTLHSNGSFRYVPFAGFQGVDAFRYQATDGFGRSAPVTATIVVGTNPPPLAGHDTFALNEDSALSVSAASGLLANDSDPLGRAMTAARLSLPAHGTATVSANGSFTYRPAANFFGTDSFRYRVTAAGVKSNVATVTLTVNNVNDAPVAQADTYKTRSNTPLAVGATQGVLSNDSDLDADPITAELISGPTSGTLELAVDGSFQFVPASIFHGTATFTYRTRDRETASSPVMVTIQVNNPPVASPEAYTIDEDSVLSVPAQGVLTNDTDDDNDVLSAVLLGHRAASLTLNGDGSFVYRPRSNYYGTDFFTYVASDGEGQSSPTNVSVTVRPVNDPPMSVNDTYRNRLGAQLNISRWQGVLANDRDVENSPLIAMLDTGPASGDVTLASDGSLTYTPVAGFVGPVSFTYFASDGTANSAASTVTINVELAAPSTGSFTNPTGGSFHTPSNWFGNIVPASTNGTARFDQARQYTVTFESDAQGGSLAVGDDDVTFDLGGHRYTVGGTSLAAESGQQARLTLRNGTYRNNGTFASKGRIAVEPTARLDSHSGDFTMTATARLENYGIADFFDGTGGTLRLTDHASLLNQETLTIANASAGTLELRRQAAVINTGTINMGGSGTVLIVDDATLTNFGTIRVSGGGDAGDLITSVVNVSAQLIAHAGSRLDTANLYVAPGGQLSGNGVIGGTLVNRGTVAIGAAAPPLAIERDYSQQDSGALQIAIAGHERGSSYGGLSVSGRAEISGTITLDFTNGFMPSPGDSFVLASAQLLLTDLESLDVQLRNADPSHLVQLGIVGNQLIATIIGDAVVSPIPLRFTGAVPPGSLIYRQTLNESIGTPQDSDAFTIELDGGTLLTAIIDPSADLTPVVALRGPSGVVLGSGGAGSAGQAAVASAIAAEPGLYTIAVTSTGSSTGPYKLRIVLNAAADLERYGGIANDTPATAQDLNSTFSALSQSAGDRGGLIVDATPLANADVDWYQFRLHDRQLVTLALAEPPASVFGLLTLEFYDSSLTLLATGARSEAYSQLINDYVDITSNGVPDTYFVRVMTDSRTAYNLIVTRDAQLEVEPNNRSSQAQLVGPTDTVLGHLGDVAQFVYQHDDGRHERTTQRRDGGDILWLNSFTAQPGADRITAISLAWSTFVFEGEPTTVLLYDDPNDDGNPADAVLLASAETRVVAPGTEQFTTVPIPPTRVHGEFFVAALFRDQKRSEIVAPLDSTRPARRSWTVTHNAPGSFDVNDLAANSDPPELNDVGNYLIRAVASPSESGEDWYRVLANAGDEISVRTATPADGPGEFVNLLNAALEVYDPSGALVISDTSSADGRNAALSFRAAQAGSYRVRVIREADSTGEYVLSVQGGLRENAPPEVQNATPDANKSVREFPTEIVLQLTDDVDPASVHAGDLLVGGRPAIAVTQIEASVLRFQIDPAANIGDGSYVFEMAAHAVSDEAGVGNLAYHTTFRVDGTPPRVIYSSIADGSITAAGDLVYTAIFSEPINTDFIIAADFALVGLTTGPHEPLGVAFPGGFAVRLHFADLPEDDYALSIYGGSGGIEDMAGNSVSASDFLLHFSTDAAIDRFRKPLSPVSPLGSLVYETSLTARINQPGDSDTFRFYAPAGAAITLVARPETPLTAPVTLFDPDGAPLGAAAMNASNSAVLPSIRAAQSGDYSVAIGDSTSTAGGYTITLVLNAAVEAEAHGGPGNNSAAVAQNLADSSLPLDGQADRSAVLGSIAPGDGDWFRMVLADDQAAEIALASRAVGELALQLYDANLNLVASGVPAGNADRVISKFVDPTADQVSDTYYVRVTGAVNAEYNLVVTRGAAFDTEGNNRIATAQMLGSTGIAVGYLARPDSAAASSNVANSPLPPHSTAATRPSAPGMTKMKWETSFVPGRLLVRFANTAAMTTVAGSIGADDGAIQSHLPLINAAVVELPEEASDVEAAAARWASQPGVLYAEPDYIYHLDSTIPNDLFFAWQLGVHNVGGIGGTADADIDAPEAWDIAVRTPRAVIAHLDSGVDYTHSDLAANIWTNPGEIAGDGIDNDGNGYIDDIHGIDAVNNDSDPFDVNGHGTHTAGTIGAIGNNGIGVAGIGWGIQIMPLKLNEADGGLEVSDAVTLLNYAVKMKTEYGVNIVASNNSWGGPTFSQALRDAIAAANDAGIMFIASAGNNGRNNDVSPHYPSSYDLPGIIAVAATDKNDTLGSFQNFSNYGITTVDIAAPGTTILSTLPGGDYGYLTGTSMAAPHVTGAVAMLAALDPDASLAEIKDTILSGSDPSPTSAGKTVSGGRLNLANSFALWSDDYFRLDVAAGQILTIRTNTPDILLAGTGNLDPALALFGPGGELLAIDDNSAPDGRSAIITFDVHQTGSYTIRVTAVEGRGEYFLATNAAVPSSSARATSQPSPDNTRHSAEFASTIYHRIRASRQTGRTRVDDATFRQRPTSQPPSHPSSTENLQPPNRLLRATSRRASVLAIPHRTDDAAITLPPHLSDLAVMALFDDEQRN